MQAVWLEDYVGRVKDGQEKIYYITADSFAAAKNSPHLQVFRRKDIEVLLLSDRVDEWLVSHLNEFDGKPLVSVARGQLDLDALADEDEKEAAKKTEGEYAEEFSMRPVADHLSGLLGKEVKDLPQPDS